MSKPRKKWPWPFVETIWMDAHSHASWHKLNDHPNILEVHQRGWIIMDADHQIVMAAQVIEEEGMDAANTYSIGDVCAIPRGCIKSIRKLKI